MGTLILLMVLLLNPISSGQQAWPFLLILVCPGSCVSRQMLPIQWWVICSNSCLIKAISSLCSHFFMLILQSPISCIIFCLIYWVNLQINACNGFYCDQFTPNSKNKPKFWTENWSGWSVSYDYFVLLHIKSSPKQLISFLRGHVVLFECLTTCLFLNLEMLGFFPLVVLSLTDL